jgi:YVTN family beta-propeller protein
MRCALAKRWTLALSAVIITTALACSSATDGGGQPTPASIVGAPDTTVLQDDSLQLRAVVRDADGAIMPGASVTYTSLTPQLATVSGSGFVRSQGPAGVALIRAQAAATVADTVTITVLDSTRITRLPLTSRPSFLGVYNNIAYVSRVDAPWVKRLDLTTTTFTDSVAAQSLPCGVVFNPAGTRAFVANQGSQNISVINVATNAVIDTFPVNGDPLPVAVSKDGTALFVTTNVNRLYRLNITTGAVLDSLDLPATSHHLFVHPNDSLLYVATRDGASVLEVSWRTMTTVRTFTLGVQTLGIEMAPNRSELYVTSGSTDSLYTVNLASGAVSTAFVGAGASTIQLNADGTRLYVGLLFAGKVEVLNRATRAHIKTIRTGGTVRDMGLDVARGRVIVTNDAGWVDLVR